MLELPEFLSDCAEQVTMANGELTEVLLGAGMSDLLIGHVNNATLTLQCALDAEEPYVLEGGSCESTPNIPLIDGDSNVGGTAVAGAITMFAPGGNQSVNLSNITFEFRERYKRGGAADFVLTSFEAGTADANHGSLSFRNPHIQLAEPITAPLVDGMVTFPPGSLRMEVSGVIVSDGEVLFGGARSSGVYVNTGAAIGMRTPDGGFAFVDAPFEAGGYVFVLNTEAGTGATR
jgi:hypothetical protein